MTAGLTLRDASVDDAGAIAAIYNHYIRDTVITFELDELTEADMAARIAKIQGAGLPWLTADEDGNVCGYAYAGPFRERAAYRHTLEASVYLDRDMRARGIGTALFAELFARLRSLTAEQSPHAPIHAVVGGVALPNEASVALHERFGMTHVGTFTEVGWKFDHWIDVGYWQVVLD